VRYPCACFASARRGPPKTLHGEVVTESLSSEDISVRSPAYVRATHGVKLLGNGEVMLPTGDGCPALISPESRAVTGFTVPLALRETPWQPTWNTPLLLVGEETLHTHGPGEGAVGEQPSACQSALTYRRHRLDSVLTACRVSSPWTALELRPRLELETPCIPLDRCPAAKLILCSCYCLLSVSSTRCAYRPTSSLTSTFSHWSRHGKWLSDLTVEPGLPGWVPKALDQTLSF